MNIQRTIYTKPAYPTNTQTAKDKPVTATFTTAIDKARNKNAISNEERMDDILNTIAPNAPQEVKDAWDKAVEETGTDWLLNEKGQMIKLPMMLASGIGKGGQTSGFLSTSVGSFAHSINDIIQMLSDPSRIPHPTDKQEADFYDALLKHL